MHAYICILNVSVIALVITSENTGSMHQMCCRKRITYFVQFYNAGFIWSLLQNASSVLAWRYSEEHGTVGGVSGESSVSFKVGRNSLSLAC